MTTAYAAPILFGALFFGVILIQLFRLWLPHHKFLYTAENTREDAKQRHFMVFCNDERLRYPFLANTLLGYAYCYDDPIMLADTNDRKVRGFAWHRRWGKIRIVVGDQ
jgi:hypothetical protein